MSVSDAAPLPRLGEVFFDVRGNSRSLRLSWYADTGVAGFSIWQAGMCTGTFRLPMADLSRMIEILERGPTPQGRRRPPVSAVRQPADRDDSGYGPDEDEIGGLDSPARPAGPATSDRPAGHDGYEPASYDPRGYGAGAAEHAASDHRTQGYRSSDYGASEYGAADAYRPDSYGLSTESYYSADYRSDGEASGYRSPGYEASGYRDDDYGSRRDRADHDQARYDGRDYGQPEYGRADYTDSGGPAWQRWHERADYDPAQDKHQRDVLPGSHRRGDTYPAEREGQAFGDTDASGYQEDRFGASYARGGTERYLSDMRVRADGHERDPGEPAYRADRAPDSGAGRYLDAAEQQESHSYGADYRYR